jgi:hypothetical protein
MLSAIPSMFLLSLPSPLPAGLAFRISVTHPNCDVLTAILGQLTKPRQDKNGEVRDNALHEDSVLFASAENSILIMQENRLPS